MEELALCLCVGVVAARDLVLARERRLRDGVRRVVGRPHLRGRRREETRGGQDQEEPCKKIDNFVNGSILKQTKNYTVKTRLHVSASWPRGRVHTT